MKVIKINGPAPGITLSPVNAPGCRCSPEGVRAPEEKTLFNQDFVTGTYLFENRSFPGIDSTWNRTDRLGQIRSRLGNFRMQYAVLPGLYALGTPGSNSPVMVSCNYKLSFDILRRELRGIDAWILVLDTKGINVWCAAGKGTFGTEEVVRRIQAHGVQDLVDHKDIILPQLAGPGVDATAVQRRTGMRVHFGPVRACDIAAYLAGGMRATETMRRVTFSMKDRLVLTPMEIIPTLKPLAFFSIIMLAWSGLQPAGILFHDMLTDGIPLALMGLTAVISGGFITPLLLPFIPLRSFALKGWISGMVLTALAVRYFQIHAAEWPLYPAIFLFFPAASSYLALQFTGSTTFTGISGVKKELRYALPLYRGAAITAILLLIGEKIIRWGLLS